MPGARALRTLADFVRHVLYRDRYLTEVLSSVVTFGVGILASVSQTALEGRPSLAGFREMPAPELWVCAVSLPGTLVAIRFAMGPPGPDRWTSLVVMSLFWVLGVFSLAIDLNNWAFWTLLALLLGVLQGYAIVRELRDLRWGVALVGAFFWVSLALSITANAPWPWPLAVATYWGWAAANLLSVSRLSGRT
jgi:hypothetical protein